MGDSKSRFRCGCTFIYFFFSKQQHIDVLSVLKSFPGRLTSAKHFFRSGVHIRSSETWKPLPKTRSTDHRLHCKREDWTYKWRRMLFARGEYWLYLSLLQSTILLVLRPIVWHMPIERERYVKGTFAHPRLRRLKRKSEISFVEPRRSRRSVTFPRFWLENNNSL